MHTQICRFSGMNARLASGIGTFSFQPDRTGTARDIQGSLQAPRNQNSDGDLEHVYTHNSDIKD